MGIKYTGTVTDSIRGRKKRQNIDRWMYMPEPKYKPTWQEVLWAIVCIIAITCAVAFFAVLLANQ